MIKKTFFIQSMYSRRRKCFKLKKCADKNYITVKYLSLFLCPCSTKTRSRPLSSLETHNKKASPHSPADGGTKANLSFPAHKNHQRLRDIPLSYAVLLVSARYVQQVLYIYMRCSAMESKDCVIVAQQRVLSYPQPEATRSPDLTKLVHTYTYIYIYIIVYVMLPCVSGPEAPRAWRPTSDSSLRARERSVYCLRHKSRPDFFEGYAFAYTYNAAFRSIAWWWFGRFCGSAYTVVYVWMMG